MKQNDLIILGILGAGLFYIYEQSKKQLPVPSSGMLPGQLSQINTALINTSPLQQNVSAAYSQLPISAPGVDGFPVVSAKPAPSTGMALDFTF